MPKKELTAEQIAAQKRELNDLAIQTRNWALRMGAVLDEKTGKHGYITVAEWMNEFKRKQRDWRLVKRQMIRLGYPLTVDTYGGHYLGKQGEQMKSVLHMLAFARTLMETASMQLEAARASGKWEECYQVLEMNIGKNRHHMELEDIPKILNGAGLSLDPALQQLFLADREN